MALHRQHQHQHQHQRAQDLASDTLVGCSMGPALALAAQNKRKEKARIAARARRSQEASIIMDMANELHITQEKLRRLDKATIVKLAIDYIKAFEILCRFRTICNTTTNPAIINNAIQQLSSFSNISSSDDPNIGEINTSSPVNDNTSDEDNRNNNDKHAIINITGNIKVENSHDNSTLTYAPVAATAAVVVAREPSLAQVQQSITTNVNANDSHIYQSPPIPKFNTGSIFAHKTDEVDSHFLVIKEQNGRAAFVLKPDTEIMDEDDLTHLAPQAGDSVSLEVDPLDEIIIDSSLFKICGCRY